MTDLGPDGFDNPRPHWRRLVRSPQIGRPVTGIRPLAIGAAYGESFEFLAPLHWQPQQVRYELRTALPMVDAGWSGIKLEDRGSDEQARRWRASRT